MSLFAAILVVLATVTAVLVTVAVVSDWSEGRRQGRKPLIIVVALAMGLVVQLPLPNGPELTNVPLAFAMVLGSFG